MTSRVASLVAGARRTSSATSQADYLLVRRPAVVRSAPSSTSTELARVSKGTTLDLVEGFEQTDGYYPVVDPGTRATGWIYKTLVRRFPGKATPSVSVTAPSPTRAVDCSSGQPMRVRFYDVGQALAALVSLPDGREVLVDTGESPSRPACGAPCQRSYDHLVTSLRRDLGDKPLSMVWVTHQHSDHVGGAADLLERFPVELYVDNGQDLGKSQVQKARDAAKSKGVQVAAVTPSQPGLPMVSGGAVALRSVLPAKWPVACEDDPNNCSVGLRIDYCASSVLFTGDAEDVEEAKLAPGQVTLLQVGHHGSSTSTNPAFLKQVRPKYAVISAGKKGEGLNETYCHPRVSTVQALSSELGDTKGSRLLAFDGKVPCSRAQDANWTKVPASAHLWATLRDGDVVLVTKGDGVFTVEQSR